MNGVPHTSRRRFGAAPSRASFDVVESILVRSFPRKRGPRWQTWIPACAGMSGISSSAPFPKFVIHFGTLSHELRKQRGTSKYMILVPLFDLKFLNELAASAVGTSNRRHLMMQRRCAEQSVHIEHQGL